MRRALGVAVLSLFVVSTLSAVEVRGIRESPGSKIVRKVKTIIRSLGDALISPRP